MSAPFTPYTAMARVRIVNATVGGEMVFAAPAQRPDVRSILIPASDVVDISLERVRMADEMHSALCRIAESASHAEAVRLAESALAQYEALQACEIDAEIAGARPAVEATQAFLSTGRIAEDMRT